MAPHKPRIAQPLHQRLSAVLQLIESGPALLANVIGDPHFLRYPKPIGVTVRRLFPFQPRPGRDVRTGCVETLMKLPVSCFMITRNEADRVSRSIRAVHDLVDEIIVVDSGSTDHTTSLAAAEGARVIHSDWPGFGRQKQFGEAQCRNDWVFNIDADEVVTPQLAAELRALFSTGAPPNAAYGVWVQGVYPGWDRPRWWARDHYCLRLYDRRRAGFTDSAMHDSVDARGQPVGHLANCIHHFSFRSLADLAAKSDARADYNARHMKAKSRWMLRARMLTEFPVNFVKYYLGRGHVTGGWTGLRVALIAAQYRWLRILRAYRFQELGRRHDSSVSPDDAPGPESFGRSSGAEVRRTTLQPLR